jgi:hypothetical protein
MTRNSLPYTLFETSGMRRKHRQNKALTGILPSFSPYAPYKSLHLGVRVKHKPVVSLRGILHFLRFLDIYTPPTCARTHTHARTRLRPLYGIKE